MSDHVEEQRENNVGGITGKGFQPGTSGNPGGRPKGSVSLVTLLRQKLSAEAGPDGKTEADKIVEALIREAQAGDARHIKEVLDRIDGKVIDRHELTGKDGGPLEIEATARAAATAELDQWRKQMTERLASLPATPPTVPPTAPPTASPSNTPSV